MKTLSAAVLAFAICTLPAAAFAQSNTPQAMPTAKADMMMADAQKMEMGRCMGMSHDMMMKDMKCMGMMKDMKMSDADMMTMAKCKGMTEDMMMKDMKCMEMKKMHPGMMTKPMMKTK